MRKIIAAFDGLKYSSGTEQYAINFAKQNSAFLVGVFLEDYSYQSYKIYDLVADVGGALDNKRRRLDKKDEKTRAAAVAGFEKACKNAGIDYAIHKDRGLAIHELLLESLYADLVIIDRKENLAHHPENLPTRFMREFLHEVQCPVLLANQKFNAPGKLVILFDGEPSSVHAVKMLSYMWEQSKNIPIEIVTVNGINKKSSPTEMRLMKEFIVRHFPSVKFVSLKGLPEIEIVKYLRTQPQDPLVVLGAYRRGKISRWFRESMADVLMNELKLPLFIAHRG